MLAAIDLHGCERHRLEDPNSLRVFVPSVIKAIGMRAHGPLRLERFGNGELEGWSAMQFIETSSITIHADEFSGRCFIDVFSCRAFDPEIAVAHFGGRRTLRCSSDDSRTDGPGSSDACGREHRKREPDGPRGGR